MRLAPCLVVLVVSGACGGSAGTDPVDSVDTVAPTTIDLADGLFQRTDGDDGDVGDDAGDDRDAPVTTESVVGSGDFVGDTTTGNTATTGGSDDGGTDGTDGSLDDETTTDGESTATDAGGGSTGTVAAGGSGTTTAAGPASKQAGPNQGVIVIGDQEFVFATSSCSISPTSIEVEGTGTSADSSTFEAGIYLEQFDFDADGRDDTQFVIAVEPDPAAAGAADVPDFYLEKIDSAGVTSGEDVTFTVEGTRLRGSGSITDFNGVAFPVDQPGPITFDVCCA